MEGEIRCAKNPSEGWEGPTCSLGRKDLVGTEQKVVSGEDAIGSDQAGDLGKKRKECKEVAHSSHSGQEPETDRSVHEVGKFKKRPNPF